MSPELESAIARIEAGKRLTNVDACLVLAEVKRLFVKHRDASAELAKLRATLRQLGEP